MKGMQVIVSRIISKIPDLLNCQQKVNLEEDLTGLLDRNGRWKVGAGRGSAGYRVRGALSY